MNNLSATTHKYQGAGSPLVVASLTKGDDARSAHVALTRCETGLRVHTVIDRETLVQQLSSEQSLQSKDDALLFERIVQKTGGPDTIWARSVRKAASDSADPLRQRHRAEMSARRADMSKQLAELLTRMPEASPERAKAMRAIYSRYALDSFVGWSIKERDRLELEWERLSNARRHTSSIHPEKQPSRNHILPIEQKIENLRTAILPISAIQGTAAAKYLAERGVFVADNTRYASNWGEGCVFDGKTLRGYGPAIVYLFHDLQREVIAAQGRILLPSQMEKSRIQTHAFGEMHSGIFATSGAWTSETVGLCHAPLDALSLATMGLPSFALGEMEKHPDFFARFFASREIIIAMGASIAKHDTSKLEEVLRVENSVTQLKLPDGIANSNDALMQSNSTLLQNAIEVARAEVYHPMQRAWNKANLELFNARPKIGGDSAVRQAQLQQFTLKQITAFQRAMQLHEQMQSVKKQQEKISRRRL